VNNRCSVVTNPNMVKTGGCSGFRDKSGGNLITDQTAIGVEVAGTLAQAHARNWRNLDSAAKRKVQALKRQGRK